MVNQPESVTCKQCGKELVGRRDKRFCDAYCRNTYNNLNKHEDEKFLQKLNSTLRKNRRILKTLCPEGKAKVRKEVLDHMGFDYRYFTSMFKSNSLYYLCYDYGFSPQIEGGVDKALIIHRQEYMDKLGFDVWRRK